MNVAQILENKGNRVVTIAADAALSEAIDLLNRHNIGVVVVLDSQGRLAGILSERDIVRRLTEFTTDMLHRPVSALMTANPVTCARTDSVDAVMQMMTGRHFRHLPVIDKGILVGLISIGDVVKTKIELTESEAEALRQYIAS